MKKLLLVLLVLLGLQTQAQITPCDSVEYTYLSGSGGNTMLQLNGVINGVYPIIWEWQVCDANLCFSDTGQTATFNQFSISLPTLLLLYTIVMGMVCLLLEVILFLYVETR
jgi:hypothetical protein